MDSTPKLSLSKLPCKPRELLEMQTPPLQSSSVSIPFHWEEAPGKPRITAAATIPPPNNKTACSLEEKSKKRGNVGTERSSFDSWRWESFGEDTKVARDSFVFSLSENDSCKSDTSVKMTRTRRRFVFLSFSGKNSIWVRVKNLFHARN
ncbi:putative protein-like [Forsythia ovata]|uniref:Uncharacterized protein n=1 Tax=Forsythia ovata TaxID=205694 RepID=A0ABD1X302_9LAMI